MLQQSKPSIVALVTIAALLTAPAASAQGKKKKAQRVERTVAVEYEGASGARVAGTVSARGCIQNNGCYRVGAEPSEAYISLSAEDTTGTPTAFVAVISGGSYEICGETSRPIWLNRVSEIEIYVDVASIPDCAGVGTTGTISATFSNLP